MMNRTILRRRFATMDHGLLVSHTGRTITSWSFAPCRSCPKAAAPSSAKLLKSTSLRDATVASTSFSSDNTNTPKKKESTTTTTAVQHQNGMASLVARATKSSSTSSKTQTSLTTIRHQAPYRLIPLQSSLVDLCGASVCYLGNYGGGFVQGDTMDLSVHVKPHAKVGLVTQGSNRIYQHSNRNTKSSAASSPSTQSMSDYIIDKYACLVVAPDPITPFAQSNYRQHQTIHLHPDASGLCVIDWYGAGRISQGEVWQHEHLQARTDLYLHDDGDSSSQKAPLLIDSVRFDNQHLVLPPSSATNVTWKCHAMANVYLYGRQMRSVVQRCQQQQRHLLQPYARLRDRPLEEDQSENRTIDGVPHLTGLSSRVLCSISEIPSATAVTPGTQASASSLWKDGNADATLFVVRLAAESNEDLYRVLHQCLKPLSATFGYEFYKDRIKSSQSSSITHTNTHHHHRTTAGSTSRHAKNSFLRTHRTTAPTTPPSVASESSSQMLVPNGLSGTIAAAGGSSSPSILWSMLTMADSALPVGSFAHSNGLEVAAQLQLWNRATTRSNTTTTNQDSYHRNSWIPHYVSMVTQSAMELYTPYVIAVHEHLANVPMEDDATPWRWNHLETQLHARLIGNPPSCRASLDQGRSLVRIWEQWNQCIERTSENGALRSVMRHDNNMMHRSGHLANVFGFITHWHGLDERTSCYLLGYCVARDVVSAAVRLNLVGPMESVHLLSQAQQAAQIGIHNGCQTTVETANSSCAPLLDVIQPCHDLLATRLFRT